MSKSTVRSSEGNVEASIAAQVAAEVNAIRDSFAALQGAAAKLGAQGLDSLARELGDGVNDKGRPEFNSWARFTFAVVHAKPSFTRLQALYGIAKGAARDSLVARFGEVKGKEALGKFVKAKTTQTTDGTACKLSIAKPAAWDIAFE